MDRHRPRSKVLLEPYKARSTISKAPSHRSKAHRAGSHERLHAERGTLLREQSRLLGGRRCLRRPAVGHSPRTARFCRAVERHAHEGRRHAGGARHIVADVSAADRAGWHLPRGPRCPSRLRRCHSREGWLVPRQEVCQSRANASIAYPQRPSPGCHPRRSPRPSRGDEGDCSRETLSAKPSRPSVHAVRVDPVDPLQGTRRLGRRGGGVATRRRARRASPSGPARGPRAARRSASRASRAQAGPLRGP
jgi:hypothetical protein